MKRFLLIALLFVGGALATFESASADGPRDGFRRGNRRSFNGRRFNGRRGFNRFNRGFGFFGGGRRFVTVGRNLIGQRIILDTFTGQQFVGGF